MELSTNREGSTTSGPFDAQESAQRVHECIRILEQHETDWSALDNPEDADDVNIKPGGILERLLFGTVNRPETQTKNLKPTE